MTQLIVIMVYLSALVLLGFVANRMFTGTSKDYMLASHTIGPFLLLMSLFGTTMTAFALLGSTGRAYTAGAGVYGLLASAAGIIHSMCFMVIGLPLWRAGRRFGFKTQIQYFRQRLDNNVVGYMMFPILVIFVIAYLLIGVVGAGSVINALTVDAFKQQGWFESAGFGVPKSLASAAVCAVVLTYVYLGGMRGTAWANALQTMVFMILGVITFFTIANAIGKTDSLFENFKIASEAVPKAKISRAGMPMTVFFSFLFIPLSVGMFPHIFQHWLTARNANAFKLPIVMHPIFVMIVWAPCVLIGIWATSSISGISPGTPENEILARLVKLHAGPYLAGLLGAGILAAIMSSLDSQFLCLGTMFTEDIVGHAASKPLSDKASVVYARLFVLFVVVAVFVLSLILPRSVFDLGLWSFTGFTGLFPIVVASIYWKRFTAYGAISAVLTTIGLWAILFWQSDFGANKGYALIPFGSDYPIKPVVVVFVASSVSLLVTTFLTKPPPDAVVAKYFPSK